jgi:hypothetical protein
MPKQPNRRFVTGNRRRLPVRRMSHNRRHMALSHEQVGFMMMLQQQILGNWFLFILDETYFAVLEEIPTLSCSGFFCFWSESIRCSSSEEEDCSSTGEDSENPIETPVQVKE